MGTHSQFLQGEAVLGFARLENEAFSRHEDLLPGGYVCRGVYSGVSQQIASGVTVERDD